MLYYVYLSTLQVCVLNIGQQFRGTVFIQTISAETAQKIEQQQQQQKRVSTYQFMHLSSVHYGLCQMSYVFLVRSCVPLCVTRSSYALLCILYASELASVGHYSSIMCNHVHLIWPLIGLCCRFINTVCYKFYIPESTLVRHQIQLQIGT